MMDIQKRQELIARCEDRLKLLAGIKVSLAEEQREIYSIALAALNENWQERAEKAEAQLAEERETNRKLRQDRAGLARECNAFEAQLAELAKQEADYTRYDCGACGHETFTAHYRNICPVCNHRPMKETGLFTRAAPPATLSLAAADVIAERQRQVSVEGWTPAHDDTHHNNEMAFAASCYAFHAAAASWDLEDDGFPYDAHPVPKQWPWDDEWWKPKSPRRDLVRAAALILSEIERLDRAAGGSVADE